MQMLGKIFNYVLIRVLSKGAYLNYQHYVYNTNPKNYPVIGEHVHLLPPLYLNPKNVELESYTRLQTGVEIIASQKQKVKIKKYTSVGAETIIIPGAHTPTVGLPQYLSYTGVNDINGELVIPEDVWIGARCIILPKAKLGRGCVVAAGSVVNNFTPPYAVIAGTPAKIIAVRFSLQQILQHERLLYKEKDRLTEAYLQKLFENEYKGLRVIGTDQLSPEDSARLASEISKLKIDVTT